MSARKEIPLELYLRKVESIVRQDPALAPMAYAQAAHYVRGLAAKPEHRNQKLHLQSMAAKLDEYAAMAVLPETDAIDAEVIAPWADDPTGQLVTEFDGAVADLAAAKVNEDGSAADDLTSAARFDLFQKERRQDFVKPVQITPESAGDSGQLLSNTVLIRFGGSSGSGSFTGSGGVAGPVVAEQETKVCEWNGHDTEVLPCRIAISALFGGANATYPTAQDSSGNTYSYRPYFRAFWGTGNRGQANEVIGDITRGTQFTVHANHVYVNVGMETFTTTVNFGSLGAPSIVNFVPGAAYVTGNLGFFAGNSTAPVTRTIYVDSLSPSGGGATTTIIVPAFAKLLLPPQANDASGQTTLAFQDSNGNTWYRMTYTNGTIVSPIPIANDIYQILVTCNGSGTNNVAYRFVFQLAL